MAMTLLKMGEKKNFVATKLPKMKGGGGRGKMLHSQHFSQQITSGYLLLVQI